MSAEEGKRRETLEQLEAWLETPMQVLSFLWLLLVLLELTQDVPAFVTTIGTVIWVVFIAEFVLRFILAPRKLEFLRKNPITVIALAAPAFRFLTVLRGLRALRALRLVRVVGTANRGLNTLRRSFGRRGLGYVLAATVLVILLGAAGMLSLEPETEAAQGFDGYSDALWWTAMVVATMGADFWPQSAEGRLLCLLLAIYGYSVFGYITASFASYFVEQEARSKDSEVASAAQIDLLRQEIAALREELAGQGRSEP